MLPILTTGLVKIGGKVRILPQIGKLLFSNLVVFKNPVIFLIFNEIRITKIGNTASQTKGLKAVSNLCSSSLP